MSYIDPRAKLMQHIDRIAEIKAGGNPAPVNVEIDLSNRCNLGCRECHFSYLHSRGPLARKATHQTGDLMNTGLIVRALKQMDAAGVRSVTWTGGGEPTLHPDFDEAICVAHRLGIAQGIYTNGTLIDPLKAALMKATMRWVYVSLDRHTREGYRAYKQVDQFERAVEGIRNLKRAQGKATIGVGFLLDESNWQDVYEMADFGREIGADYVQFRPLILYSLTEPNRAVGTDWIDQAHDQLADLAERPWVALDIERFRMYADWGGHGYTTCYWTQMQTVITPDGRVWTCLNRRGFEGDALGDLNDETFSAIWSRAKPYAVNGQCRVMCRGHIPNLALNQMMSEQAHGNFI